VQERAGETPSQRATRERRERETLEAAAGMTPEQVVESLSRVRLMVNQPLLRQCIEALEEYGTSRSR